MLKNPFRLFVCALSKVVMSKMPLCIDEIEGWPIVVRESMPDGLVVIYRDGILDPPVPGCLANVLNVVFKGELRRVYADHHQSLLLVFLGPCTHIGK